MPASTNAQGAAARLMEPPTALWPHNLVPPVPYDIPAWEKALVVSGLHSKFPSLISSLRNGFNAGIRPITTSFTPQNSSSVASLPLVFKSIIDMEFKLGRYRGPYTQHQVESLIGPFQSSPLSLVPKNGPDSFRLIQNLSFPFRPIKRAPSLHISSINSSICSDFFACTWGTFGEAALLIFNLPPGSQASTRDVADAYRTIPLAPDQWPGTVVRIADDDAFAINLCNCFGLVSAGGNWGVLADCFCELARSRGFGPHLKWVDDFLFARIPRKALPAYNEKRLEWRALAAKHGLQRSRSRLSYRGDAYPDGRIQEFSEDFTFPLVDHSLATPRGVEDSLFSYSAADLDLLSDELALPWKVSKTTPFATSVVYLGFLWDIDHRTVALPDQKKTKYKEAIRLWSKSPVHTLRDVETLYGKLMHASHVSPEGRAYLTGLEAMLSIFGDSPDCPRHAPKSVRPDLAWWDSKLGESNLFRRLPSTQPFPDLQAFSDASSSVGIGITIGSAWSAFALAPGWRRDGRDIAWAEAVGFELLLAALDASTHYGARVLVFCDNQVVVQGWRNGRSRNRQVNEVFKRIHAFTQCRQWSVIARYVPSGDNPADGPSRGTFPVGKRLPPTLIPRELAGLILPANDSPDRFAGALPKENIRSAQLADEVPLEDKVESLLAFMPAWRE